MKRPHKSSQISMELVASIYVPLGTTERISIHIRRCTEMKSDADRLRVTVAPVALLAQPLD